MKDQPCPELLQRRCSSAQNLALPASGLDVSPVNDLNDVSPASGEEPQNHGEDGKNVDQVEESERIKLLDQKCSEVSKLF